MGKIANHTPKMKWINWNVESIIKDFYRNYPEFFEDGKVQLCSKLFYPIALLELEVLESAGEEFDTIEHTILSLFYAGLHDPEQISDVLGLPVNYINQMIDLLQGYGHLNGSKITELGVKSAEENVKYTKMRIRQKVQADTLTGLLLRKEMVQRAQLMFKSEETNSRIPHVAPRPHLQIETLEQINRVINKYKYSENAIFHTNVESIENIITKEIKYTNAILLQFTHIPHPVVLVQFQKDSYSNNKERQLEWRPTAISESNAKLLKYAGEELQVVVDECFISLSQLVEDIEIGLEHSFKNVRDLNKLKLRIEKQFAGMVDVEKSLFEAAMMNVDLDASSLTKINREIFSVLESIALSKYHIPYMGFSRDDEFPGFVCYVETKNEELEYFSMQMAELWMKLPPGSDIYNSLIQHVDFQSSPNISVQQLQSALNEVVASLET